MNEIVNNFLLARDRFMPELHFRHSGLFYNVCGPFTRTKKEFKNSKNWILKVYLSNRTRLFSAWHGLWRFI